MIEGRMADQGVSARPATEPSDIDVLEIYDCFSIAVAMQLEAAGFELLKIEKNGEAFRFHARRPFN